MNSPATAEVDFAISFAGYSRALRRLVHLLKYERLRAAANLLGAKLAESSAARTFGDDEPVLMSPVPLHRAKHRQRGFNRYELIARSVLRRLGRPRFDLHAGNLRRVRKTVSQTGLSRHHRGENARGAFVLARTEALRDRSVLIVDDAYTTHATLNECARVLRGADAVQVVATVARVYRSVVEMVPGGMQEENPAVLVGAVAG